MIANDDTDRRSWPPGHQKPSDNCSSVAASILAPWEKRWLLFNGLIVITVLIALRKPSFFTDWRVVRAFLAYIFAANLFFACGPLLDLIVIRLTRAGRGFGRFLFIVSCLLIVNMTLVAALIISSFYPHPSVDEVLAISQLPALPADAGQVEVQGEFIGGLFHGWHWYFLRFDTSRQSIQEFLSGAGLPEADDSAQRRIDDDFVHYRPNSARNLLPPASAKAYRKRVDFHAVYVFVAGQTVYVATVSDD